MKSPKTDAEWFKHLLYADPEFSEWVSKFREWSDSLADQDGLVVMHLLTSKDMSLKSMLIERNGDCEGSQVIEATAKRFEVPERVVEYGFIKRPDLMGVTKEREPSYLTKENFSGRDGTAIPLTIKANETYIRVSPNTRLEDIETLWPLINKEQHRMPSYVPQLKSSLNPNLVYAIYKQRLSAPDGKRKSFSIIFRMYQDNELPDYDGSIGLSSSDSLERHYRRHIPKPDSM